MESIGLAVGVVGLAGLFSVCIDVVQRFDAWKKFDDELAILGVRVAAERLRLDRWGQAVGFKQDNTSDIESHHHPLLDDGRTFAMLEVLVQKLHDLVPPDEAHGGADRIGDADQQAVDDLDGVLAEREEFRTAIIGIERSLQVDARRELCLWLLGRHTPNEVFEKALNGKLEKTCEWMLNRQEFLDWASSDFSNSSAKYLWIHSPPAFGKTVLCATLLQRIKIKLRTPVAYYFFSSEDLESRRDPFVAVRSWLVQLLPEATVFDLLRSRFESSHSRLALTGDVVGAFEEVMQTLSECTFVIDGLDECESGSVIDDNSSVSNFLKTISRVASGMRTRMLITSREETAIRQGITNNTGATAVEYKITQQDVRPDIDEYSRFVVRRKLIGRDERTCEDLCQKMAERCEGQFLWIKLKGSRLSRYKTATFLEAEIEKTPSGLNNIYGRNWDRIEAIEDPYDRERAYAMMRWVSFAARPLSVAELTAALLVSLSCDKMRLDEIPYSLEDDYVENEILKISASLLEIHKPLSETDAADAPAQTVHFTHFTAKQYFLLRIAEKIDTLMVNERLRSSVQVACNNELASKCLHYIGMAHAWKDAGKNVHPVYRAFRDYAADAWFEHAAASDHDEVVQRANDFFTGKDSVWKLWRDWFDLQEAAGDEPQVDQGPLYYAARFALSETARYLIESGHCNANEIHLLSGYTILQMTIHEGRLDTVQVLLISMPGADGSTALHAASFLGEPKLVEMLLDRCADVNAPDWDRWTPLRYASVRRHVAAVRILLDRGADLSAGYSRGMTALHMAAEDGELELVQVLLDRGADVNTRASNRTTPLHCASKYGRLTVVEMLLNHGADRCAIDDARATALHVASAHGHIEVVQKLLQEGGNGNARVQQKISPLFQAVADGNVDAVELLLERGGDPFVVNHKGLTLAHAAARYGYLDVLRVLLDAGLSVDTDKGLTALHQACVGGHADVVRMLLACGANVNAMHEGMGALHAAAFYGHLSVSEILLSSGLDLDTAIETPFHIAACQDSDGIIRFLLERGAKVSLIHRDGPFMPTHATVTWDRSSVAKLPIAENASRVNARTTAGSTPALLAAAAGHVDILQMLIDHGADVSIADNSGWTPVHRAVGTDRTMQLLLDEGGSIHGQSTEGDAVLHIAPHHGYEEIIQLLLNQTIGVDAVSSVGATALHLAVDKGHSRVVKVLLENGSALEVRDGYGRTPLVLAAASGHKESVGLCLEFGAFINAADPDGNTPLIEASYWGHTDTVQLLLEKGANTELAGKCGQTPLFFACYRGNVDIVKLLVEAQANKQTQGHGGDTSLLVASPFGRTVTDGLLAGNGAKLETRNKDGRTLLIAASCGGSAKVVELLLGTGCCTEATDIEARDRFGQTALAFAVRFQHRAITRILLSTGKVNLLSRDHFGRTPVSWAKQLGYANMDDFFGDEDEAEEEQASSSADDDEAAIGQESRSDTDSESGSDGDLQNDTEGCDVCWLRKARSMGFRSCELCPSPFSYHICNNCYDLGARCRNEEHILTEMPLEAVGD
ncbi:hypothetical protein LLEC1_05236 [Akanthomyces lecanii]|uniref:Uncharacterized protein n=1 Tax=Cordyceps confragosa TaxID=2714763 RepID=A0A179I9V0_CORDF|nr:hypothetical protein LLEC1_05236 [Akanthomyces lecanii]